MEKVNDDCRFLGFSFTYMYIYQFGIKINLLVVRIHEKYSTPLCHLCPVFCWFCKGQKKLDWTKNNMVVPFDPFQKSFSSVKNNLDRVPFGPGPIWTCPKPFWTSKRTSQLMLFQYKSGIYVQSFG